MRNLGTAVTFVKVIMVWLPQSVANAEFDFIPTIPTCSLMFTFELFEHFKHTSIWSVETCIFNENAALMHQQSSSKY